MQNLTINDIIKKTNFVVEGSIMSYKKLKGSNIKSPSTSLNLNLTEAAVRFIHDRCEDLRFDPEKERRELEENIKLGTGTKPNQIDYNMQMDVDRLCMENEVKR